MRPWRASTVSSAMIEPQTFGCGQAPVKGRYSLPAPPYLGAIRRLVDANRWLILGQTTQRPPGGGHSGSLPTELGGASAFGMGIQPLASASSIIRFKSEMLTNPTAKLVATKIASFMLGLVFIGITVMPAPAQEPLSVPGQAGQMKNRLDFAAAYPDDSGAEVAFPQTVPKSLRVEMEPGCGGPAFHF